MAESTHALKVEKLYKVYNEGKENEKVALRYIDLEIPRGSFFGLLGPNGAGKSTLINILASLVNKTSGTAYINGYNMDTRPMDARRSIGVVPQELVLDPFFPVYETLENIAGFYGVPKKKRRTREIIDAVGLTDKAYSPARSLSGGMRRRLLVAKALVHAPKVLILDEPTAGVDIELRTQLWNYVRELNSNGTTVLLTTHYLEEAESLCNRIAIINKGQIIANDSKKNIISTIDQKKLIITTEQKIKSVPKELAKYDVECAVDNQLIIKYKRSENSADEILSAFHKTKLTILDISTEEADLEDVFRHLIAG